MSSLKIITSVFKGTTFQKWLPSEFHQHHLKGVMLGDKCEQEKIQHFLQMRSVINHVRFRANKLCLDSGSANLEKTLLA